MSLLLLRSGLPLRTSLAPLAASTLARAPGITSPRAITPVRMSSSSTPYQVTATDKAPSAIGPYSQAVVHNGLIFCSGSIPLDPKTMQIVEGGIEEQTIQALNNLVNVIEASGGDKSTVLKTTVFLKNMGDFATVNGIYEKTFAPYKPARSAVEVARLPKDVLFEIECVAAVKK